MNTKPDKPSTFSDLLNILFLMLLCFATLLTTMLMRGKVLVGSGEGSSMTFTIDPVSLSCTAMALGGYLLYILLVSDRQLKDIVNLIYGKSTSGTSEEALPLLEVFEE